MIEIVPITLRDACDFIDRTHRHHRAPRGWRWGAGAERDGVLVGVAVAGRPVARSLDDGRTVEILRLASIDSGAGVHRGAACSMLYGAMRRAAWALGYRRILTYTLEQEPGVSLRAAGFVRTAASAGGGSWSRATRPRIDKAPIGPKQRWECTR